MLIINVNILDRLLDGNKSAPGCLWEEVDFLIANMLNLVVFSQLLWLLIFGPSGE